jgi:hypothetical protein
MSKLITRGAAFSQSNAENKTADEVLNSIITYVRPTAEISMWLTRIEPEAPGDSNWNAGSDLMPPALLEAFLEVTKALRASDSIVEWPVTENLNEGEQRIYRGRCGPP